MEPIHVFYSWQSDLNRKENRFFIRDALRTAVEQLNGDPDSAVTVRMDSDTQGKTGSPDIVDTIFRKIDRCNIFVADISIINAGASQGRKTPNPNVLLELGYASHRLGWERIICVVNETSGKVPDDLPFDLHPRLTTRYKYSVGNDDKGIAQRQLAEIGR